MGGLHPHHAHQHHALRSPGAFDHVVSGHVAGAGLSLVHLPQASRRESFLYRSDSEFESSPKSTSRHSSITSEAG